ncbi:MAG: molybdenum cofactor guanylyltransferase [Candidatus Omnitrophota bacterium]
MDEVTGIILAGGKSTRMGKDKSFIPVYGRPIIEIVIDKISSLTSQLLIITNKPCLYRKYGIKTKKDILHEHGSLGGIYTSLVFSKTVYNLITACDMPFINMEVARYMIRIMPGYDCVVLRWRRRLEPLFAIYSKHCIRTIEDQLKKKNLKISDIFSNLKTKIIMGKEIRRFDPCGRSFVNINTRQDALPFSDS